MVVPALRISIHHALSPPAEADDQTRKAAVTLYGHGLSLRCVGKLLATTAHSVIRWVTEYVETRCSKPAPEGAVVIEVDEMWHYLGDKTNKLWIWTALDRATGRLIDWECGGRDQVTFERLLARLRRWNVRLICTDEYGVYQQSPVSGPALCRQGPDRRSRTHTQPAAPLAGPVPPPDRRSRSREMVDRSIALIAHLHINQEVEPSFCHLPLAQAVG